MPSGAKTTFDDCRPLSDLMSVLADPTRLILLHLLRGGPACVSALVRHSGLKQANVSKQLGLLHRAHLVDRERRGNQIFYSVNDPFVFDLCSLVCGHLRREAENHLQQLQPRNDDDRRRS